MVTEDSDEIALTRGRFRDYIINESSTNCWNKGSSFESLFYDCEVRICVTDEEQDDESENEIEPETVTVKNTMIEKVCIVFEYVEHKNNVITVCTSEEKAREIHSEAPTWRWFDKFELKK